MDDKVASFQQLLGALEAQSLEQGKVAWTDVKATLGVTSKPLASLLTFQHFWCPRPEAVLQRALSTGGELRALAELALAAKPRELWEVVLELPLKGVVWLSACRPGERPLVLVKTHQKAWAIHDASDFSVVEVLKPTSLGEVVFSDDGGLRANDGSRILARGPDEKRWRTVAELGSELGEVALGPKVAAAVQAVVIGEGDDARLEHDLVVCLLDTGVVTRHRVASPGAVRVCGTTVVVNGENGTLFVSDAGQPPVKKQLAPDLSVHELAHVRGALWLNTWRDRAATSGPWRRLDDLTETEWGGDFEAPTLLGDQVWSISGERVKDGVRSSPIAFEVRCRTLKPLNEREVIAIRVDAKDKMHFMRLRRMS